MPTTTHLDPRRVRSVAAMVRLWTMAAEDGTATDAEAIAASREHALDLGLPFGPALESAVAATFPELPFDPVALVRLIVPPRTSRVAQ